MGDSSPNLVWDDPRPDASRLIIIGYLSIDALTRSSSLHDQPLALTSLEFNVLIYLARHASRVVTPDDLLHEVWHCSLRTGGTKNQVNCCLKRLRHKLGSDGALYIVTVRGIGYRMLTDKEWQAQREKLTRN